MIVGLHILKSTLKRLYPTNPISWILNFKSIMAIATDYPTSPLFVSALIYILGRFLRNVVFLQALYIIVLLHLFFSAFIQIRQIEITSGAPAGCYSILPVVPCCDHLCSFGLFHH